MHAGGGVSTVTTSFCFVPYLQFSRSNILKIYVIMYYNFEELGYIIFDGRICLEGFVVIFPISSLLCLVVVPYA